MFRWALFKHKVCKSVFDKYLIIGICIVAYVCAIQKRIKTALHIVLSGMLQRDKGR